MQHISVALPEVLFHRLSIFSPLAAPATPISAKFLLTCALSLCLPMNVPSLTLTHESTKLVAPPSSFYILACYDHSSSMSCFCFLREGHCELVANNNVLSVYCAISTLTRCIVGGVASEPKGMTSVLLVVVIFPAYWGAKEGGLG